jgi:uncharacterized protein YndB with AHSA1/START domain
MSTAISQEIDFKASPQRVYEALTDGKHFGAFTGHPANIDLAAGARSHASADKSKGEFSTWSPIAESCRHGA